MSWHPFLPSLTFPHFWFYDFLSNGSSFRVNTKDRVFFVMVDEQLLVVFAVESALFKHSLWL